MAYLWVPETGSYCFFSRFCPIFAFYQRSSTFIVLSKSTKIILNYVFGIGLFLWLSYSIYHQLKYKNDLSVSVARLKESVSTHWFAILAVIAMMFVNWGIEARKWQMLIRPVQTLSFRKTYYAILSGVSFSVNTPNRIGEYGGRILYLKSRNRLRGVAVTMVGSLSQFLTTVFFGLIGFTFYLFRFDPLSKKGGPPYLVWNALLVLVVAVGTAFVAFVYFRLDKVTRIFGRLRWLRRFRTYILIIGDFPRPVLWKVLGFSVVRYLLFSAQYLILLEAMGVQMLWWQGFMMIFLIYMVLAVIPTIAIAELGIRGEVGLYCLGLLSANKIGIIAGTVGIWLINLVIPAIIGSLLLLGIKVLNEDRVAGLIKKQQA